MRKIYRFWSARLKAVLTFVLVMAMGLGSFNTLSVSAEAASESWIEDGIYYVTANLYQAYTNATSMGNYALRGSSGYNDRNADDTGYKSMLIVEDGKATLLVEFMPMGFLGMYGYLWKLDGVTVTEYSNGYPSKYGLNPATVLTEHRNTDGSIATDAFNVEGSPITAAIGQTYPRAMALSVELPSSLEEATYSNAPYVHVFVPVMEAISEGNGDQLAKMFIDYSTLEAVPEEDLSTNVEYWLYRAVNTEGEGEAQEALTDLIDETKALYSNTLVSIKQESATVISREAEEPDTETRAASVAALKDAIAAAEESKEDGPADDNPYGAEPWDGETTKEPAYDEATGYYQITNAEELAWFAAKVNSGNDEDMFINGELLADINLGNKEWTPIGNGYYSPKFGGSFKGNGHTVYNLYISSGGDAGLFGNVGGTADSPAAIDGVTVEGSITGVSRLGGIAGLNFSTQGQTYVSITNCTNRADITSTNDSGYGYIGGIIGSGGSNITIKGCVNEGNLSMANNQYTSGRQEYGRVAGIAASLSKNSTVEDCVNRGDVTATNYVAGLVAFASGDNITIINSWNEGHITGQISPSALVDYVSGENPTVRNLYNTGKVTGTGKYRTAVLGSVWSSAAEVEAIYSVGPMENTYSSSYTGAWSIQSNTSPELEFRHMYVLEGTAAGLYMGNATTSATVEDVGFKSSEWLKSDAFFENIGTTAFSKDIHGVNNGYPILAEQADYTAVDAALAKVPEADALALYTEESVSALQTVVDGVVRYMSQSEQATVDGYVTAIENAIDALTYKSADYSGVEAAIAKIPEDLSIYTTASVSKVQDARDAVVYDKNITEQATVDGYAAAIEAAVEALVKVADYSAVDAAIASVPDLSIYTEDTAEAVNTALNAVERGLGVERQSDVDAMADAINRPITAV